MNKTPVYDETAIVGLSGIDHIRLRPEGYISDTLQDGLFTIIREIYDNSQDEMFQKSSGGTIQIICYKHVSDDNYTFIITDNGRGVPIGKLKDSFTKKEVSGKFNTLHFTYSGGLYGVGATVCFALSDYFRVISLRDNEIGDLRIHYTDLKPEPKIIENKYNSTGTIVIFKPDPTIFTNIGELRDTVIQYFTNYISGLSIFNKYRIQFTVIDDDLPIVYTKNNTNSVIDHISKTLNKSPLVFDNNSFDRQQYVNGIFGIDRWDDIIPVSGHLSDNKIRFECQLHINTQMRLFNTKSQKLTFVNGILFTDNQSVHINTTIDFLKFSLGQLITDSKIKSFFMNEYTLPIWLLMDVKFSGAQFSGFAKTSFRDAKFKLPFHNLLKSSINQSTIEKIFKLIYPHVELIYNKYYTSSIKSVSSKNVLAELNYPGNYKGCVLTKASECELFIVEGESAAQADCRNANFQALYALGGKPQNIITDQKNERESIKSMITDKRLKDIVTILNLPPKTSDLSKLNFNKLIIMADADSHGYHISSILTGNIAIYNPNFIKQGFLYIALPPLYSISYDKKNHYFVRDQDELMILLAKFTFKYFSVQLCHSSYTNGFIELDEISFIEFYSQVTEIGELFDRLEAEYAISSLILEHLALYYNLINTKNVDINKIMHAFNCEAQYSQITDILTLCIGAEDIIIPLPHIRMLIETRILPFFTKLKYGVFQINITSKKTKTYKDNPVSLLQLYKLFSKLRNMLSIERYKGLSAMGSQLKPNCTHPETRNILQVTDIGDLDKIFSIMGTDPSTRKLLVKA